MEVCLPELAALILALNVQELKQFGRWRLMSIADESSKSISPKQSGLETSENAALTICEPLTSSPEDFPVRTLPTADSEQDWPASAAAFGMNTLESFASWDRASSSWR